MLSLVKSAALPIMSDLLKGAYGTVNLSGSLVGPHPVSFFLRLSFAKADMFRSNVADPTSFAIF